MVKQRESQRGEVVSQRIARSRPMQCGNHTLPVLTVKPECRCQSTKNIFHCLSTTGTVVSTFHCRAQVLRNFHPRLAFHTSSNGEPVAL